MKVHIRSAAPEDLAAVAAVDDRAFGTNYFSSALDDSRALLEPSRFLLASDSPDGPAVGVTGSLRLTLTLPGGGMLPVSGVTWVGVVPTHRRRGVLRALMVDQHRRFLEDGITLTALTASEGSIYGRFGYGPAGRDREIVVNRRAARFRASAPDPGDVRYVDATEVRLLAPEIHRRWAAGTPGAVARDDRWWDYLLLDRKRDRDGMTSLFHLAHPDGYASYRIGLSDGCCRVVDLFTATDDAHAALWRVLLGLDLVRDVKTNACPLDDQLPFLLEDPRQVRTTDVGDGLWTRILDVPVVLAARRYGVELDVLLDVTDTFLDRGGRFRLRAGPDGACCEPGTGSPEVYLTISTLATLLFGTHRATTLARAGLLRAEPAVLLRLDAAFASDREVRHGTGF